MFLFNCIDDATNSAVLGAQTNYIVVRVGLTKHQPVREISYLQHPGTNPICLLDAYKHTQRGKLLNMSPGSNQYSMHCWMTEQGPVSTRI